MVVNFIGTIIFSWTTILKNVPDNKFFQSKIFHERQLSRQWICSGSRRKTFDWWLDIFQEGNFLPEWQTKTSKENSTSSWAMNLPVINFLGTKLSWRKTLPGCRTLFLLSFFWIAGYSRPRLCRAAGGCHFSPRQNTQGIGGRWFAMNTSNDKFERVPRRG